MGKTCQAVNLVHTASFEPSVVQKETTKTFIQSAEMNTNKIHNTDVVVTPLLMLAASWLVKI